MDEIVDFNQSDLIEEDVMLLDTWDTILVWIGSKSNPLERERTIEMVEEYLKADPSERDLETPIIIVKQGSEPPNFTGFFGSWDRNYWSSLATSNPNVSFDQTNFNEMTSTGNIVSPCMAVDFSSSAKYPLSTLRVRDALELPADVDPTKKEV